MSLSEIRHVKYATVKFWTLMIMNEQAVFDNTYINIWKHPHNIYLRMFKIRINYIN